MLTEFLPVDPPFLVIEDADVETFFTSTPLLTDLSRSSIFTDGPFISRTGAGAPAFTGGGALANAGWGFGLGYLIAGFTDVIGFEAVTFGGAGGTILLMY
jgi:hypothetical protein